MLPETARYLLDNNTSRRIRAYNPATGRNEEIVAVTVDLKSTQQLPGTHGNLYDAAHAGKISGGETGLLSYVRNSVGDTDSSIILSTQRSFDDYRISFSTEALRKVAGIEHSASLAK